MRRMLSRPGRPRFLAAVAAVVLVTPLGLAACTSGDADGSAETSATSPAGTPLQLEGVLDTGFNVEVDGFGFPNYGNGPTPKWIQRPAGSRDFNAIYKSSPTRSPNGRSTQPIGWNSSTQTGEPDGNAPAAPAK